MLKFICLFVAFYTLSSSLASTQTQSDQTTVVTSFSVIEDLVQRILAPEIKVINLVPRGIDPHHYELTPQNRQQIDSAKLIFLNGGHFELWLENVLKNESSQKKGTHEVPLIADLKNKIQTSTGEVDPHAWLDPENAIQYLQEIEKQGVLLRPEYKKLFHARSLQAQKQIQQKAQFWKLKLSALKNTKIATSHESFQYFARYFDLQIQAIQGTSPEGEILPQNLSRMIQKIKSDKIKILFLESTVSPTLLEQISRETGARIGGTLEPESLPKTCLHYEDWLELNAKTIWQSLN